MAQIDVETKVTAPTQITVPLVRADLHQTANVFRMAFEVFLALTAAMIGHILALPMPMRIHWIFLTVCALATAAFAFCSYWFSRESKKV